ncbi:hypothetical protein [Devosia sp.]|uniref:hypothetical protein n=1 Tax=Devosia sp. TaxID=1871048 RepID=UPI003BABB60E
MFVPLAREAGGNWWGPVYRKAGRFPIYAPDDLDTWAQRRIGAPRRSTSVPV